MQPDRPALKEYAGGWITERADTQVPAFPKFAYIAIAGGALTYFLVYMYGDVNQPGRGELVRAMNAATQASALLMYAIAAMILIFGIVVVAFAFAKPHD
jgi:hypothetical protein